MIRLDAMRPDVTRREDAMMAFLHTKKCRPAHVREDSEQSDADQLAIENRLR